jgi:hypothetical protein
MLLIPANRENAGLIVTVIRPGRMREVADARVDASRGRAHACRQLAASSLATVLSVISRSCAISTAALPRIAPDRLCAGRAGPYARPTEEGRAIHGATARDEPAGRIGKSGFISCRSRCRPTNGDIRKIRRNRQVRCRRCTMRGATGIAIGERRGEVGKTAG